MSESQFQSEAIRAASQSLQTTEKREVPKNIVLSNGIVLKVKPMPPMLLNSVANSIPEPPVPKVWIEDKQREEENPNHPAYVKALEERQIKLSMATNNLILCACTEVEYVPDGIDGPDSDNWLVLAKMAGIEFDVNNNIERYLAWLRCSAIATAEDMTKAMTVPLMLSGITEMEVQEVLETFRSGEGGGTDSEIPVEQPSSNGNHVQVDSPRPRGRPRRA